MLKTLPLSFHQFQLAKYVEQLEAVIFLPACKCEILHLISFKFWDLPYSLVIKIDAHFLSIGYLSIRNLLSKSGKFYVKC